MASENEENREDSKLGQEKGEGRWGGRLGKKKKNPQKPFLGSNNLCVYYKTQRATKALVTRDQTA